MKAAELSCLDERRRHEVRRHRLNGLDYLEVADDQRTLTVYFLGAAPEGLTAANVRICGGRRIRDIRVLEVEVCPQVDPELDNCIVVTVDRPGDHSTYTLCLVDLPPDSTIDPRYRCLDFSFKVGCPTDLDCAATPACPPEPRREPEISYLAKDYASFRRLVLDRLAVVMPEWKERHVPDLGITLVELLAYVGDHLSYHQDAVATEAYLDTSRQRISVRRHARLVDYRLHEGCNARAWVHVETSSEVTVPAADLSFLTGFTGQPAPEDRVARWIDLADVTASRYEVFEPLPESPDAEVVLRPAHNEIRFHTWGDAECCLPRGATSATLVDGPGRPPDQGPGGDPDDGPAGDYDDEPAEDPGGASAGTADRALHLEVGDGLILEEVIGPETGDPADADPTHRRAVRLTRVEPAVDELYGQPVLEVSWAEADALPFPLCISTVGPPPECALLENVSVARGNVLLVDHGRRVEPPEALECVPVAEDEVACEREGRPSDVVRRAGPFRPVLGGAPLTFSQPLEPGAPASEKVLQDPAAAVPSVALVASGDDEGSEPWGARPDLLASGSEDRHFVVEMDDRRRAHLRFGDGELGRAPEAGACFEARYRVGNGPAGNVGADTIVLAVTGELISGVTLRPRNPLPARGGTAEEPVAEAKLFAPYAFRQELARAITADDYARLGERHPEVQRAAAELRWNGSWYEVRVGVDPLESAEADEALLEEVETSLYPFRRIGHDLSVDPAAYVPLDLVLEVCVEPGHQRGHVQSALMERFGARRLADGSLGFFHPDALSFDQAVSLSRLVAAAQAVPGVQSVSVSRLERLFEGPAGELDRGVLPIGPLEIARLDSDPSFPENGRIRFEMRGGR